MDFAPAPARGEGGWRADRSGGRWGADLSGAEPVETLLLLVAERAIKLFERGLHGLHRAQHRVEPLLHRLLATTKAARRSDRGIGAVITECVSAEHAVVEVIVRIGPERVICIGVERVIDEVVVGVGPEQWADPADHDRVGKMAPPLRVEEPVLERRVCERARTGIAGT